MSTQEITYKNRKIIIETEGDNIFLMIDNQIIPVTFDQSSNMYSAVDYIAYEDFSSIVDLSKALIDSHLV